MTYAKKESMGFFVKIGSNNLYLVTSEEYSSGRDSFLLGREAVESGIDILQLREKTKTREEIIALGRNLLPICKSKGVIFIVNDDPFIAREIDADGVHLGQEDLQEHPIEKVRGIIGKNKIIGVSTHSVEQFIKADKKDIDYIAFGPIFHTKTKEYDIGDADVEKVLSLTQKPVVFIGGINLDNVDRLLQKGVKNIAVIRGISESENVPLTVKEFKRHMKDAGKNNES